MNELLTESQLHSEEEIYICPRTPSVDLIFNAYLDKILDELEIDIMGEESARHFNVEIMHYEVMSIKTSPRTLIYLTYLMSSFDEFVERFLHISRDRLDRLVAFLRVRLNTAKIA